jgi:hypothetical protein
MTVLTLAIRTPETAVKKASARTPAIAETGGNIRDISNSWYVSKSWDKIDSRDRNICRDVGNSIDFRNPSSDKNHQQGRLQYNYIAGTSRKSREVGNSRETSSSRDVSNYRNTGRSSDASDSWDISNSKNA